MKSLALPLAAGLCLAAALPAAAQSSRPQSVSPPTQAQVNMESDVVLAVKQRLAQLGYKTTPNQQFDADLRNNVLLFQSDNGLRPTGNVDLSTLAALGIDVDPSGRPRTAMAEPPVQQTSMSPGEARYKNPGIPYLRDQHMTSPQYLGQGRPIENQAGNLIPESQARAGQLAGFSPAATVDDLKGPLQYQ